MLSTQHNDKAIHNLVTFCDSTRSSEILIHNQMLQLSGDLDCPIPKLQMKIKSEEIYFSLYFSSG